MRLPHVAIYGTAGTVFGSSVLAFSCRGFCSYVAQFTFIQHQMDKTKQRKKQINLKQNLVGSSKKVWSRVILEENRKFIRGKKLCKVVRKNRLVCIKNL